MREPDVNEEPEYIVGPRYHAKDLVSGIGQTFKLELDRGDLFNSPPPGRKHGWRDPIDIPKPVAGAIQRSVWANSATGGKPRYVAQCQQCGDHSKGYLKKNEPSLWRWALGHRCGMTIILTLEGGIVHSLTDVGYIDTESGIRGVPTLIFRGYDWSTEIGRYERWLKVEVIP